MTENYICPQCNGSLEQRMDDEFKCENCGLNMTEVLENVAGRGGPLEDVASKLLNSMGDKDCQQEKINAKHNERSVNKRGIDWDG